MAPQSRLQKLQAEKSIQRWNKRPRGSNENIDGLVSNTDFNNNEDNSQIERTSGKTFVDQSTQTEDQFESKSTQTAFDVSNIASNYQTKIQASLNLDIISDLIEILKDSCLNWNSKQDRILSLIIYILLRHLKLKYNYIGSVLNLLNCMTVKYAHMWSEIIIEEGVISVLVDNRGKFERSDFYEMYPDILTAAKLFSLQNASRKNATFTVSHLARFITEKFIE
jgi:hypothetical protein